VLMEWAFTNCIFSTRYR